MVIHDNVKEIGGFRGTDLREVVIPEGCEKISDNAFRRCEKLRHVVFGPNVREIGMRAFDHTLIRSFEAPESLEKIGDCAFAHCRYLRHVQIASDHVKTGKYVFGDTEYQFINNVPWYFSQISIGYETDPLKREALIRIRCLENETGLNPHVSKYYSEGHIYYSYFTAGGMIGSIDWIYYDPRYTEVMRETERIYGIHVYHAVEIHDIVNGLALLYVEKDEDEWEAGRPVNGLVCAYVYDMDRQIGEFGSVRLRASQGAL